ncbi:MAG: GNAT family N-acetyltransferase, partial [Candidatus Nucleicultricaceae bacterium]
LNELKQWLSWANTSYTPQRAEETMRQFHASYVLRSSFHYLIFKGNRFIGMVGLSELNWEIPSASVEFWCRTSELGHGYITEAMQALTQFAFDILNIQRLQFVCDSSNERAQRLAERIHYKLELIAQGLLKKPNSDELRTCHQYSCYQSQIFKQSIKIDFVY